MMIKYYLQKIIGNLFKHPIIPKGRTTGYSFNVSEEYNFSQGDNTKINEPFFIHNVQLGEYSYISYNCRINNTSIGKFCSIGPNCCCGLGLHPINGISTSPMFYSSRKQNGTSICSKDKVFESLHITIGNDVFIGANVTILDGVTINDGAVIGAGAVVTHDIPPYAIAVGVPAKPIKYRFDEVTINKLLKIKWWDKNDDVLKDIEKSFFDINSIIDKYYEE